MKAGVPSLELTTHDLFVIMSEDHELQKLLLVPNAVALVLFLRVQV